MEYETRTSRDSRVFKGPDSAERQRDLDQSPPSYQSPRLIVIGTAVDLMKSDINGDLVDGIYGWWAWSS